jgi:hypothetical protein
LRHTYSSSQGSSPLLDATPSRRTTRLSEERCRGPKRAPPLGSNLAPTCQLVSAAAISLLHPQAQRLAQTHSIAVERGGQQRLGARHLRKQCLILLHRQHHRNALALGWVANQLHSGHPPCLRASMCWISLQCLYKTRTRKHGTNIRPKRPGRRLAQQRPHLPPEWESRCVNPRPKRVWPSRSALGSTT